MAGFPKNPLAGPDPFRDAEGRNPFRDDAPRKPPSTDADTGPDSAPPLHDAAFGFGSSDQARMREYQVGDFSPLASARSGRVTLVSWSGVALTAVGWVGWGLGWLGMPDSAALWMGTGVWFVLATILACFALGWSGAELAGIKVGAIDPRAEPMIRAARRKAWLVVFLALAGLVAVVVSMSVEVP